jgi:predicted transcriptional regulator
MVMRRSRFIMVRAQHRLGVNPTQFCILIQLLEHWRTRERAPFPTKQQLADRIGVSQSTIQQNMQQLEKAGLVKRVKHKTASGDWGANTYHLDGLVARLEAIEPEFEEEKEQRKAARRRVETPKGKRQALAKPAS